MSYYDWKKRYDALPERDRKAYDLARKAVYALGFALQNTHSEGIVMKREEESDNAMKALFEHLCEAGAAPAPPTADLEVEIKSLRAMLGSEDEDGTIEDGFGSAWSDKCPACGLKTMHVNRPGDVQCDYCDGQGLEHVLKLWAGAAPAGEATREAQPSVAGAENK